MLRTACKLVLALVLVQLAGGAGPFECISAFGSGNDAARILYDQPVPGGFDFVYDSDAVFDLFQDDFDSGSGGQLDPKGKASRLGISMYKGGLQTSLALELPLPKKPKKDRRLVITSKQDDAFGFTVANRPMTGRFDARVTVAVDDRTGLVHNTSFAALEMQRPPDSQPLEFVDVIAAYVEDGNGDFLGFNCSAFTTGGAPIGTPVLLAGTAEVDLRIEQDDAQLRTWVRPTPAGSPAIDQGGWTMVSSQDVAPPVDPFVLGFGANGLDKKGTVYFDFFSLSGDALGGEVEGPIMTTVGQGILDLDEARTALRQEAPDLEQAAASLTAAVDDLEDARDELGDAADGDELLPSTESKLADKALVRSIKLAGKVLKAIDKGKTAKPDKLATLVTKAIDDGFVAVANLAGGKVPSARKLSLVAPPAPPDPTQACTNPAPTGGEFATATTAGAAWVAETLLAQPLDAGGFQVVFEDCSGEGSYLLIEFDFPGEPSVGEFTVAPFSAVNGFARNVADPEAFGVLFSGTLDVTTYDAEAELIEATFTTDDLFTKGDAIADGAFRVEAFGL